MHIWIVADACRTVIKDILDRAAEQLQITLTLVANKPLLTLPFPLHPDPVGPTRFDMADKEIAQRVEAGDLVLTGDIPLAVDVIERGAHALDPRGDLYTADNIGEKLQIRNFMDGLRASGVQTGGPAAMVTCCRACASTRACAWQR